MLGARRPLAAILSPGLLIARRVKEGPPEREGTRAGTMTDVAIDERPPGAGAPNNRLLLNVGLLLLLVILGVGLLYAYRAQSPAMRQISYTEAVTQIQNGQIQRVAIQGERARITRTDGSVEEVTLPDGGQ